MSFTTRPCVLTRTIAIKTGELSLESGRIKLAVLARSDREAILLVRMGAEEVRHRVEMRTGEVVIDGGRVRARIMDRSGLQARIRLEMPAEVRVDKPAVAETV